MQRMLRASGSQKKKSKTIKKVHKRGKGRPKHIYSKKIAKDVRDLSAAGYNREEIAEYLELSVSTLEKYYAKQLKLATPWLAKHATRGLRDALLKKQTWAICFFLKTRLKDKGWLERAEVTGKDGKDLFAGLDLSKLSEDKFKQLKELLKDAGVQVKE